MSKQIEALKLAEWLKDRLGPERAWADVWEAIDRLAALSEEAQPEPHQSETSKFPAVIDAKKAAHAQLAYYREMLPSRHAAQPVQPAGLPEGWVAVPREPTQEMCQHGQWKAREWPRFPLRIVSIYAAMIAAAPPIAASKEKPAQSERDRAEFEAWYGKEKPE